MSQGIDLALARERVGRVFRYLQELHRIRTPPVLRLEERAWALRLDALPRSGHVQRGFELDERGQPLGTGDGPTRGFVLKVGRPKEPECPGPGVVLVNWLKAGWDRVGADPETFLRKTLSKGGRRQAFDDDEARALALEEWLPRRAAWEAEARHAVDALAVFQTLFDLRARFQRESEKYQLFLADGMLVLDQPGGPVHHPLLIQRVELRFDPAIPEFTLAESDDNPELYTPALRHAGLDGEAIQQAQEAVERDHFHPLGGDSTREFLVDLVHRLWPDGEFLDDPAQLAEARGPVVHRQPHLFLGNRAQGLAENLERYLEALPEQTELPEALLRVVGIESEERPDAVAAQTEPLLTKPANPEQEQVIRRLAQTGAVLVQGPPGTGKSHTIANLVGHLLAQEKSVLVTSHTSKALRVVREKLAEPLQPLCVSLLQTDEESSRQLEESINGIVNTLAGTSEKKLAREIAKLEGRRETLRQRQAELSRSLEEAVRGEYEPLELGDETLSPAAAARFVADAAGAHDWLPGPLEAAEPPLSEQEITRLYEQNARLAEEDEAVLTASLPDVRRFPSAREFAHLHDDLAALERSRPDEGQELWLHEEQSADELAELGLDAKQAVELLHRDEEWLVDALEAGCRGGRARSTWLEWVEQSERCAREIPELESGALGVEIRSGRSRGELLATARAVHAHLEAGRKIGRLTRFTRPAWTELVRSSLVDGAPPGDAEAFRAIAARLEVDALRADLERRWEQQLVPLGAPPFSELGPKPERKAAVHADEIRRAVAWHDEVWAPCAARFAALGLDWGRLERRRSGGARAMYERTRDLVQGELEPVLELRQRYLAWRDQRDRKAGWLLELEDYSRRHPVYPVIQRMKKAIRKGDYDLFAASRARLEELLEAQGVHREREQLLDRLASAAPGWAGALRERRAPHDGEKLPGELGPAWRFRRCQEHLARLARLDPGALQEKLDATREELLEVTAATVEKRAWRAQRHRTGLAEQQALTGWLGLHKKMGKGTGKNVARLKEEAQKTLAACRAAVPVWIMPLSRVVESFDLATTRFDVVILDEASQSDVLGLAAFALGREVAVVGDHEQVSPYAVGQRGDRIQALIDEILVDVPNKQLYDGKTSVYDLARQSFGGTIRLLEHFRCVPDIIQFSNDLCYRGEIRALREASSSRVTPHLVAHRVAGGFEANGINENEALEIASLVSALCRLEEYDGCTVGVICLVGTDQALYIDSVLRRRLSATEYGRRQILCGNASQFQGDERDVIFLSLVNAPSEKGPLALRQRDDVRKVFNVASSRARDQLWVVHSLDPGRDLKPGDLRARLIAHAENPAALRPTRDEGRRKGRSELEKRLHTHLAGAGFRLLQRYAVGEYELDLVVEGAGGRRAAIHCDGDREVAPDALAEETERQLTLARLGWEFLRVRASEFFRAPERTLARLERRLEEIEIRPLPVPAPGAEPEAAAASSDALDARVRKRAEQIRARWKDVPSVSSVLGLDE